MENNNTRVFVAELVGTAILVLGGCGTAVFSANSMGTLAVASAFGLSLLILAYAIGGISGCHVNPAVTLGMYLGGKIESGMLLIYWSAQIVGGLIGGLILWATFKLSDIALPAGFASNGFGEHSPSLFKLGSVALIEVVMTALLIMVVLSTTHKNFPIGFGGLAAGVALWVIHLVSIPVSNTSVNPARSMGVALFASESWPKTQLWAFFVFPLIGGVLGAFLWKGVAGDAPRVDTTIT